MDNMDPELQAILDMNDCCGAEFARVDEQIAAMKQHLLEKLAEWQYQNLMISLRLRKWSRGRS
jgi:hypothetical protein